MDLEAVMFCRGGENAQNKKVAHSMTNREASGVLFKRRFTFD